MERIAGVMCLAAIATVANGSDTPPSGAEELVVFADAIKPPAIPPSCKYEHLSERVEDARAKWQGLGIKEYSFTVEVRSFESALLWPSATPFEVRVRNGNAFPGPRTPGDADLQSMTVEGRFAFIGQAIAEMADCLRVAFDETFGFPVSIYVDPDWSSIDDEIEYVYSDFGS